MLAEFSWKGIIFTCLKNSALCDSMRSIQESIHWLDYSAGVQIATCPIQVIVLYRYLMFSCCHAIECFFYLYPLSGNHRGRRNPQIPVSILEVKFAFLGVPCNTCIKMAQKSQQSVRMHHIADMSSPLGFVFSLSFLHFFLLQYHVADYPNMRTFFFLYLVVLQAIARELDC